MGLKQKRDHLSCYPILLININITRQLHYMLRAVHNIEQLGFFVTRKIIYHLKESYMCLKVSDPKTGFRILHRKKLCFICLEGGHLSVSYLKFKKYKCKKCSTKLNISVCSRQVFLIAAPLEELQNTNITSANINNKNILLQTAYSKLSSFNSNETNDVRIILDT